jgi:chemotaxis methyl-accepting protein methylase/PAS domain-containing protein
VPPQAIAPAVPKKAGVADGGPGGLTGFPIVGIGCSAGGLEALEKFFSHVPRASGMAYVVVQHLAPDHASALPTLIGRFTSMPVAEAADGVSVRPDHVYVIPPNRDLSVLHGRLHLFEPAAARGLRLPIDFFLRALAEDWQEHAIGVVLSGMGSDGAFGLAAIKEKGGLTLAQDPVSAEADSMPSSAIRAGVVDLVVTPESMPVRIADFLRHAAHPASGEAHGSGLILSALDKIVILLRDRSGNDFSLYKTTSLVRRVERRMAVHQIAHIDEYTRQLRGNAHELDLLFKELLIGVTSFFRDPEVWDSLRDEALPALLAQYPAGKALRAWVPACSTGEEAYGLAMVFKEALARAQPSGRFTLQIYATDLDPDAIDSARKGLYPENIANDVSPERLSQFFVPRAGGGWRVVKDIREMVVFATQNVTSDPPFTKLDVLTCRNLLIYFGPELQKKVLSLFHYALVPGGLLLLGNAETIGSLGHLFAPLNPKARIYQRLERTLSTGRLELPTPSRPAAGGPAEPAVPDRADNLGQLTDQLIQQTWAPPAVLVNADGDILYISGRTGKYLEPAAGKTNTNVHAMAREGLREALAGVIVRALSDPQPIQLKGLRVGTNGGMQVVDLIVQALDQPEALKGRVIIVFKDVAAKPARRRSSQGQSSESQAALMLELQQARDALQANHEAMQTTVEELKSSNEELQSTNEELQSTNEELTTSKEEMQSLNEELQTVNAELQSKVEDLTEVRNDMANLLDSTEIATVFLTADMKLRRYTACTTKLFKLIPGDIGRPLSDIVTDLAYPRLREDAVEVLRTLQFRETEASTADGRWFRVRVMPYHTQDNRIDGVVITFTDITQIKQLEARLRAAQLQPLSAGPS